MSTTNIVEPSQFCMQRTMRFGPYARPAYVRTRQDRQVVDLVMGIHREHFTDTSSPELSSIVGAIVLLAVDASWESSQLLLSAQYKTNEESSHHLDVNLRTMMARDSAENPSNPWVLSGGLRSQAEQLRIYADKVVRRAHIFHEKLVTRGLINDSKAVNLASCLLCGHKLQACTDCDLVAVCVNQQCEAAAVETLMTCHAHPLSVACCQQCFETNGLEAPIVRCPDCGQLCCQTDRVGCKGRVVIPSDPNALKTLRSSGWGTVERTHALRLGPCESCAVSKGRDSWRECGNVDCPSHTQDCVIQQTFACPECAGEGSLSCRCGEGWICEFCVQTGLTGDLAVCPRCSAAYCSSCHYIARCFRCGTTRPCDDCLEEEGLSSANTGQGTIILEHCGGCLQFHCRSCIADGDRCSKCPQVLCEECRDIGCTVCIGCGGGAQMCYPEPQILFGEGSISFVFND